MTTNFKKKFQENNIDQKKNTRSLEKTPSFDNLNVLFLYFLLESNHRR